MWSLQEDTGGHGKVRFYTTEFSTLTMVLGSEFSTLTPYEKPNFGTLVYFQVVSWVTAGDLSLIVRMRYGEGMQVHPVLAILLNLSRNMTSCSI